MQVNLTEITERNWSLYERDDFGFEVGQKLVWDVTCVDTFAQSYLHPTVTNAGYSGYAANGASQKKHANLSI